MIGTMSRLYISQMIGTMSRLYISQMIGTMSRLYISQMIGTMSRLYISQMIGTMSRLYISRMIGTMTSGNSMDAFAPTSLTGVSIFLPVPPQRSYQLPNFADAMTPQVANNTGIDFRADQRILEKRRTEADRTRAGDDKFQGILGGADTALTDDGAVAL